jgi:hypothetical protein
MTRLVLQISTSYTDTSLNNAFLEACQSLGALARTMYHISIRGIRYHSTTDQALSPQSSKRTYRQPTESKWSVFAMIQPRFG